MLLNALPETDRAQLLSQLTPVEFAANQTLVLPDSASPHSYFIERGFVSAIIRVADTSMDVGLIGPEGMVGVPTLLGSEVTPYLIVVRQPVRALGIGIGALQTLMRRSMPLNDLVIRYVQAATAQVIYNSFASAHSHVGARVARWLLMAHDRSDGDTVGVTHTNLSTSVGVQRSGVTYALQDFESVQAIRTARGSVTIVDREKLKAVAGPAYGPAEAAYRALIPPLLSDPTP